MIQEIHGNYDQMKYKEYIEFKESINERIEELEEYYEENYDQPFMKYIQNAQHRLKKLIMFEPNLLDKIDNGNDIKVIGFGLRNQNAKEIGITLGNNYTNSKGYCDTNIDKKGSSSYTQNDQMTRTVQSSRKVYLSHNQYYNDERIQKSQAGTNKGTSGVAKQLHHKPQYNQQQYTYKSQKQQPMNLNKHPPQNHPYNKGLNSMISPLYTQSKNNSPPRNPNKPHQYQQKQHHQKCYNEDAQYDNPFLQNSAQKCEEKRRNKHSSSSVSNYSDNQGHLECPSMKSAVTFNPNSNQKEKTNLNNYNKAQEMGMYNQNNEMLYRKGKK